MHLVRNSVPSAFHHSIIEEEDRRRRRRQKEKGPRGNKREKKRKKKRIPHSQVQYSGERPSASWNKWGRRKGSWRHHHARLLNQDVKLESSLSPLLEKEGGERKKVKNFSTNSADLHLCRNFPIHGFVRQIESFLLVVLGGVLSKHDLFQTSPFRLILNSSPLPTPNL